MNPHQITRLFPNASKSLLRANANDHHAKDTRTIAKLERNPGSESVATNQSQESAASRIHLRVVSVRKRLCDPDNLSPKWLIDCLRFIDAIPGDESDKITLETTQKKAAKGEEEHTIIEITYP